MTSESFDRQTKPGFHSHVPIVHFNVGIAHFTYHNVVKDGGYWTALARYLLVEKDNRPLTSNNLAEIYPVNKRTYSVQANGGHNSMV